MATNDQNEAEIDRNASDYESEEDLETKIRLKGGDYTY